MTTISELIEQLKEYPPDYNIYWGCGLIIYDDSNTTQTKIIQSNIGYHDVEEFYTDQPRETSENS